MQLDVFHHSRSFRRASVLVAIVAVGYLVVMMLYPFIQVLLVVLISSVLLRPVHVSILRVFPKRTSVSAFLTVLIGVTVVLVPLFFLLTELSKQMLQVYNLLQVDESRSSFTTNLAPQIRSILDYVLPTAEVTLVGIISTIEGYGRMVMAWGIDNVDVAVSSISTFILDLIMYIILLYYAVKDGHYLRDVLYKVTQLSQENNDYIYAGMCSAVNSVVRGNFIIAFTQGALATVSFLVLGIPSSIFFGTLVACVSLIPRVGTALVMVPVVLYLLSMGEVVSTVLLGIWSIWVVGIVDNILGPKLLGKELALHPSVVLLSVIGGIVYFGPLGIIFGPLTISLGSILATVYMKLARKEMSKAGT